MSKSFTINQLAGALALMSFASIAGAAGLDRSGQPSAEFTKEGTYAYASAYRISPKTSGKYTDNGVTRKYDGVAQDYNGYGYGVKTDLNDKVSIGVFYDQPFGAEIEVEGNNNPLVNGNIHTKASVKSDTFTGLVNFKLGQNDNFRLYGGPVLSKLEGDLNLASGERTGSLANLAAINGYTLNLAKDQDYGYMVGAAYVKPEIGLKLAVTYRSKIEHDIKFGENMPALGAIQTKKAPLKLPESVNIDFQTGLNPTTLLTAKARWVPWGDFKISPPLLSSSVKRLTGAKEAPLVAYSDDSYMLELGLGKRLSPALAISGTIGWDKGAGNPVTVLGPAEGYYSIGLGAKYNVTPEWSVALGGKYLMLGDANTQLSSTKAPMGKFKNNDAYVVGLKLEYASK
ncbi:OmpP1/FadL family transporter [Psychrobacter lutiphocae]|uniref:OmpP1/FadL family transporter n=1 Tax=Psychrobacter lutiphocae TaxID=540500 RepID=UPI000380F858|nr:outer membrane protein transport protein [Psychrobacter lutiphocae]